MRNIFYEEGIANHSRSRKIRTASNFKDSKISIKCGKKKKLCHNEKDFGLFE